MMMCFPNAVSSYTTNNLGRYFLVLRCRTPRDTGYKGPLFPCRLGIYSQTNDCYQGTAWSDSRDRSGRCCWVSGCRIRRDTACTFHSRVCRSGTRTLWPAGYPRRVSSCCHCNSGRVRRCLGCMTRWGTPYRFRRRSCPRRRHTPIPPHSLQRWLSCARGRPDTWRRGCCCGMSRWDTAGKCDSHLLQTHLCTRTALRSPSSYPARRARQSLARRVLRCKYADHRI